MITKIEPKEVDSVKRACAEAYFLCNFFTIENNANLVQVEITELDGKELLPQYAFTLGRILESRRLNELIKYRIES